MMRRETKIGAMCEKRLFALLRLALWHGDEDVSVFDGMTEREWSDVYELSVRQGVMAVAFDGMRMLPQALQADFDNRIQWGYNADHAMKMYRRQLSVAEDVCRVFSEHGLRMMIMKGLSIAQYYPVPAHRQFGDIDIYLMGDYEKGNEIVAAHGTEIRYDFFVHSEFRIRGINIENHKTFVNAEVNRTGAYVQRELERLADGIRPLKSVSGAYFPSPEFNALYLTRHATWHYAREGIKMRDLCDWAVFLHNELPNMDVGEVMRMLRESGLERYASIVTGICRKYLGLGSSLPFSEDYPELVERVKDDIMTFENPDKHRDISFIRAFRDKICNRIERKWCYDLVVPDSFYGNILYSIGNYLSKPAKIFKAKL